MQARVIIAGGGLAGSEAAWQLAEYGARVTMYEMRPAHTTPAHKTDQLAELVCSNSLKSNAPGAASWLLKEELRRGGSVLLRLAGENAVPGGAALAVDRERFSAAVTATLSEHPLIEIRREELTEIPSSAMTLIATGPLTSDALAQQLQALTGSENLAFYDSISPIVDAETLDLVRIFRASRYGKGGEDYLNCPMDERDYQAFYEALRSAESVETHAFEDAKYFEACLPIEELARRGVDTLRFGPMRPVGLIDPRTGRRPYAVVQLRPENLRFELQPGGIPEPSEVPRAEANPAPDSGTGARRVPALRPDPPEHLHQRAQGARARPQPARGARGAGRGPTLWRRRLRGVHRHRIPRRTGARATRPRRNLCATSADHRARFAGSLHHARRSRELSAGEHLV